MALLLPNSVGGILFDGEKAVGSSDCILHSPDTSAPAQEPDASPGHREASTQQEFILETAACLKGDSAGITWRQ